MRFRSRYVSLLDGRVQEFHRGIASGTINFPIPIVISVFNGYVRDNALGTARTFWCVGLRVRNCFVVTVCLKGFVG